MKLSEQTSTFRASLLDQYRERASGVLHLGAHKGQEREIYKKFDLKVMWVEANPEIFKQLEANIASYEGNVALCALVADVPERQYDFHISNNSDGVSSSLYKFGEHASGPDSLWPDLGLEMVNKISLRSTTLDLLYRNKRVEFENYDFWVLDLQGAELLALKGAAEALALCKYLYVEVSLVEVYEEGVLWEQLQSFLTDHGFVALWQPEISHDDVLFCKYDLISLDVEKFQTDHYQRHNASRLDHLASLQLGITGKNVLEIAAGIGDHTTFYLEENCRVTATDVRPENILYLKSRFKSDTNVNVRHFDMDNSKPFDEYFDLIHCYGALYHSAKPKELVEKMATMAETLICETCVSVEGSGEYLVGEPSHNLTQAFSGTGCRPSRSWLWNVLQSNYEFVYSTRTQPDHEEFPLNWRSANNPNNRLTRCVFVASHSQIENANLVPRLIDEHDTE